MDNEQTESLVYLIEQRFAQAVTVHNALTRSVLCEGRTVQPIHATLTYAEGQLVELSRLRRLMRKLGRVSHPVAVHVLEDDIRYWRSVYASHVDADQPSMVWLAYSNGALEAAESALVAVQMSYRLEEDGVAHGDDWPIVCSASRPF